MTDLERRMLAHERDLQAFIALHVLHRGLTAGDRQAA